MLLKYLKIIHMYHAKWRKVVGKGCSLGLGLSWLGKKREDSVCQRKEMRKCLEWLPYHGLDGGRAL